MTEPITKARALAFVRMQAPDLTVGEKFIRDFGLSISARTPGTLYARGTDSPHHIYILHEGPLGFRSLGLHVDSMEDLERLQREGGGTPIEKIDEPGGGYVVRLQDPHGFTVEAIYGMEELEVIDPGVALPLNIDGQRNRVGRFADVKRGPSTVKRLGHIVLESKRIDEAYVWYWKHFGILRTDQVVQPTGDIGMQFARLDRGLEYTDHHSLAFQMCLDGTERLQHVSFEVHNIDDLMVGHDHLKANKAYKHIWGIGRHRLGGQIYDYWKDPWGRIHEHWADTDLLNCEYEATVQSMDGGQDYWGAHQNPTPAYLVQKLNLTVLANVARVAKAEIMSRIKGRTKPPVA